MAKNSNHPILKIITKNVFTLFNFVNLVLALMVIFVGSFKNLLFIFIAIANTLIGIINEVRAYKIVQKMRLISEQKPTIQKGDQFLQIAAEEIQVGDIVMLSLGDQILFDSKITEGNIIVNESFITGEQDNLAKTLGNNLISGSFVVAGTAKAKVEKIGADNFVNKLEKDAKNIKTADAKLFKLMNKIVKYISYALIPVGVLLFWSRYQNEVNITNAVTSTVAALINMIPEGLILLTSSVLALATIRLGKKQVLIQDLYAIETLARVDTICLDKTGTLTTGKVSADNTITKDELRKNAPEIIQYFYNNNIDIKVISGDKSAAVERIARAAGVKNPKACNLSIRKGALNYKKLVQEYNVFAKVQPDQKKSLVLALKKQGRTVAMTGDGVNDILAMKEADCSIAIGEGTDAARRTAKIVLLASDFGAIPSIIDEGRQSINNLERSTTLFLTKTVYATILAIAFVILPLAYPFIPVEMSLLNFLCIGLPGFVLALEPNTARIKDLFVKNIKRYSIPFGIAIAILAVLLSILANVISLSRPELATLAALTVFIVDFILIYQISKPLNRLRATLLIFILLIMVLVLTIPFLRQFFEFSIFF